MLRAEEVTKVTEEVVTPILQEENLELVDIEYVKEGRDFFSTGVH